MTTRRTNGAAIRALREAIGIPHGDFAASIKISAGYLTNIEKNARRPAPDITRAIADRLGVPLDAISYLVSDDRDQVPA